VPLKLLLKELVDTVAGAAGAMLLASDGEAIEWYACDNGERLRLRGAYVAVMMQRTRSLALQVRLTAGCLIVCYEGASFVAREIERDCFLVLELNASANVGLAVHRIQPMAARIYRELGL
jgi:predicted regulator of Ras-like GTPase activity (Roadblock/LC7/MglB family)